VVHLLASLPGIEFRILGPLEVLEDGRAVALGGSKQRALLAVFLLHANEPLTTDRLIEELWGGCVDGPCDGHRLISGAVQPKPPDEAAAVRRAATASSRGTRPPRLNLPSSRQHPWRPAAAAEG
jgi:hypothetical protein